MREKRTGILSVDSVKDNLRSYFVSYVVLLSTISFFEIAMIVRSIAFHIWNKNWTYRTYFISYTVLLIFSLVTLLALIANHKTGKYEKFVHSLINTYGIVILLWSAVISYLDLRADHTMIVFMTIIVCVAAVLNMNPFLYAVIVAASSGVLLYTAYALESELVLSGGYIINFSIYVLFAVILSFVQRRVSKKNYAAKSKLQELSYFDQLTGVYNRYSLREHLDKIGKEDRLMFGVIDVDNFKKINDRFGHDVGDTCLILVSNLLQTFFGSRVYRFGGDEFVVITEKNRGAIKIGVEEINGILKQNEEESGFHISAGFTLLETDGYSFTETLSAADHALYRAKEGGKSRVCFSASKRNGLPD